MQKLLDGVTLTHEKVVGIWVRAPNLEELHEVVKLAVDVAAYCDWTFLKQKISVDGFVGNELEVSASYHWLHVGLVL